MNKGETPSGVARTQLLSCPRIIACNLLPKRIRRLVLGPVREALNPELSARLRTVEQTWNGRNEQGLHRLDRRNGLMLVKDIPACVVPRMREPVPGVRFKPRIDTPFRNAPAHIHGCRPFIEDVYASPSDRGRMPIVEPIEVLVVGEDAPVLRGEHFCAFPVLPILSDQLRHNHWLSNQRRSAIE